MKKLFFVLAFLFAGAPAFAVTAYWTGQSHLVTTVTYQQAWNCEYRVGGQTFWQAFVGTMCPLSIEIQ